MPIQESVIEQESKTLYDELVIALKMTTKDDFLDWGKEVFLLLPKLFFRRVKNLAKLVISIPLWLCSQTKDIAVATCKGELKEYVSDKKEAITEKGLAAYNSCVDLLKLVLSDPIKYVPDLFLVSLGFWVGSGGMDGDGGIGGMLQEDGFQHAVSVSRKSGNLYFYRTFGISVE